MSRFIAGAFAGAFTAALITMPLMAIAQNNGTPQEATFQAPFTILGASGDPILKVEENSNGALMTMLGPGGQSIKVGATASGMAIGVYSGDRQFVSLGTQSDALVINLVSGARSVALVLNTEEQLVQLKNGDAEVASLGVKAGTNSAVRVGSPDGKQVFSGGSSPANSGAGALYVKDAAGQTTAYVSSNPAGSAIIGMAINGHDVARLEPNVDGSGGKLTIADQSGTVMVAAGQSTAGKGVVCAYGGTQACMQPK